MNSASLRTLDEARAYIRELEDELAEWRRQDADKREALNGDVRFIRLRDRVPKIEPQSIRILLQLLDHASAPQRKEVLCNVLRREPDEYFSGMNILNVYMCKIRRTLRAAGLGIDIKTVRGFGYLIERSEAARFCAAAGLADG